MILSRGTIFSLTAHVVLIMIMVVKVSFFSKPRLDLSEAIRVDMVGLPEKYNPAQKTTTDLPEKIEKKAEPEPVIEEKKPEPKVEAKPESKPEPKAEPKPEAKPEPKAKPEPDTIKLEKAKQKQKAALEKLKKESAKNAALDKIRQQVHNEKIAAEVAKIQKGRVISRGTALTGVDRLQSDNYTGQLDALVKAQWALPQWLIGKPLKTKVLVKIEPDGRVSDKKIVQSSGNPTYDDYCLQAVTKASPFPKVPEKFTEIYSEDGVIFGFPE